MDGLIEKEEGIKRRKACEKIVWGKERNKRNKVNKNEWLNME